MHTGFVGSLANAARIESCAVQEMSYGYTLLSVDGIDGRMGLVLVVVVQLFGVVMV
jgi:hypothetical protein